MTDHPHPSARRRRRVTLALVATLAVVLPLQARPLPLAHPEAPALRDLAASVDRRIGTAVQLRQTRDPDGFLTLTREFSGLTPMNELKWIFVQPAEGVFNFGPAETLIALAEAHDMDVTGHTLVWKNSLPAYVRAAADDPTRLAALLHDHINAVVGHFRGSVDYWDVVNEPLNKHGDLARHIWSNALGPGYIERALRWAHEADPGATLFINEYRTEGFAPKSNALHRLAKDLLARGAPLHAVGFQFHVKPNGIPPKAEIVANLQRFADLGLDILITELDLRVPTPPTAHALEIQAQAYQRVIAACLEVERCRSVTTWGFTDRHSWSEDHYPDEGASLLFDKLMREKPAYFGVAQPFGLRAPEAAVRQAESSRVRRGGSSQPGAWRLPAGGALADSFPVRRSGAHVIAFTAKRAQPTGAASVVQVEVDGSPVAKVDVTSLLPTAHHVVVPLASGSHEIGLRNVWGGAVDVDQLGLGGSLPARKFEHRSGGRPEGTAWWMDDGALVRNPVLPVAGLSTLHVRAKLAHPPGSAQALRVGLDSVIAGSIPVDSAGWEWYRVPFVSAGGRAELELTLVGGGSPVLVDRIAVSPG